MQLYDTKKTDAFRKASLKWVVSKKDTHMCPAAARS